MRPLHRIAALVLLFSSFASLARADVSPVPTLRWVADGGVNAFATVGDTLYLGGSFQNIFRRTSTPERFLDLATGALRSGCAAGDYNFPRPDGTGRLWVIVSSPYTNIWDANGPFPLPPGHGNYTLRIGPDCRFERGFRLASADPADPLLLAGGLVTVGARLYGTSAVYDGLGTPTGQAASFSAATGERLAFRRYPGIGHVRFIGPAGPSTLSALAYTQNGATAALVFADRETLELSAPVQTFENVRSVEIRTWLRAGVVYVWRSGDGSNQYPGPLAAYDQVTLQPLPGWTSPIVHRLLDLEVIGGRIFLGGPSTVNGVSVPSPSALLAGTGDVDPFWQPTPILGPERFGAAPLVSASRMGTDGQRLYVHAEGMRRVGTAPRVRYAAFDATTGALEPWSPNVLGGPDAIVVGNALYAGGFEGVDGRPARHLAAVHLTSDTVLPWVPCATTAGACAAPVISMAILAEHLYFGTDDNGRLARASLDTGTVDAGFAALFTRQNGNPGRIWAMLTSGTTLYAVGEFASVFVGGQQAARNSAAALDPGSQQVLAWNPNVTLAEYGWVTALTILHDRVYLAGEFTAVGGQARGGFAAVDRVTGAVGPLNLQGLLEARSVVTDGSRLFLAGNASTGQVVAAVQPDGVAALFAPVSGYFSALAVLDNRLYGAREWDIATGQLTANTSRWSESFPGVFATARGLINSGLTSGLAWSSHYVDLHPRVEALPPGAPRNLTAQTSGNTVALTWATPAADQGATDDPTPIADGVASSYVVRAGTGSGLFNLADFDTGSLATSLTTTAPNGVYFVRVHARNAFGLSPASNEVSFTLGAPTCSGPPAMPGTLSASVSGLSVDFTWGTAAGASTYVFEAGSATGLSNLANVNLGTGQSFAASAPPGTYFVRVRGTNACGLGPASNEVSITLGTIVELPGAPANLTYTLGTGNTVSLDWSAPTTGGTPTGYLLEAGSAPGLADITAAPVAAPPLVVPNVPPGVYYVRVRAVNAAGQGPATGDLTVTVP